jgi:predicted TIM-barrel fold metal-dependent hydrolase
MTATNEDGPRQNGEIIDAHVHLLPERRTRSLVRWVKKFYPAHPTSEEITLDEVLADLAGCGVDTVFNMVFPLKVEETESLNLFSKEISERYDNVVGFGSLHIETPAKDEVAERCMVEYGLAGIKLHPYAQRFEVFSPEFDPLYRKLDELGRPCAVHTGFDLFYGRTQDLNYLRGILERYPNMPVVLVHALFPRFKLAYELLSEYPQVYLDMTNAITSMRWYEDSPDFWRDKLGGEEIERNLDHFHLLFERFSSRMMFGTDHPVGMGRPAQIYADLEWFGFDPEVKANLLGQTARAFYEAHCRPG